MNQIDQYISSFSDLLTRERLIRLRSWIREMVPEAEESISYGMPAYKLKGKPFMYFAGYKKHIGLYAMPTGHAQFAKALQSYKRGKGSVQFPHEREFPENLIREIIEFRKSELMLHIS